MICCELISASSPCAWCAMVSCLGHAGCAPQLRRAPAQVTPNLYGNLVANVVRALPALASSGPCIACGACAPAWQAPRLPGLLWPRRMPARRHAAAPAARPPRFGRECLNPTVYPSPASTTLGAGRADRPCGAQVAGLTGGPGILPGVNVGDECAVFEQGARHVAKDIAGRGIANPTAALLAGAMLLRHLNLPDFSDRCVRPYP